MLGLHNELEFCNICVCINSGDDPTVLCSYLETFDPVTLDITLHC